MRNMHGKSRKMRGKSGNFRGIQSSKWQNRREILRERGLATAAKKASRVAAEGMVYADYCPKCKVGVVIEVNAETDFVAKNDKFVAFVKEATKVIMLQNPADVEALMACKTESGTGSDQVPASLRRSPAPWSDTPAQVCLYLCCGFQAARKNQAAGRTAREPAFLQKVFSL